MFTSGVGRGDDVARRTFSGDFPKDDVPFAVAQGAVDVAEDEACARIPYT